MYSLLFQEEDMDCPANEYSNYSYLFECLLTNSKKGVMSS